MTGAIEVSRHPTWTGNARLELRHAADSDGLLSTVGLAYKIDDSWTCLGKNTLAATQLERRRRHPPDRTAAKRRGLPRAGIDRL